MDSSSSAMAVSPTPTDRWSAPATGAAIVLAGGFGALVTLAGWLVLRAVSLPAFNTSMVTRALATAGTVLIIAAAVVLVALWSRDRDHPAPRPRWRQWLTVAVGYLCPAGLVLTTTGLPLSATALYLDGLQVDQAFRTQFLTRMTQTAHLADMNYWGLPSYYPSAWFWGGGRLANLLGLEGWAVFQPWALISIAAAACMLVPVWQRLTGSLPQGVAIALTTTAIILVMHPDEPYAAIIALGTPAAILLARRSSHGSWFASCGLAIFLGVSASMYTLYTALVAGTAVVIALLTAIVRRSLVALWHLLVTSVVSIAIALIVWGPYLLEQLTGNYDAHATAMHFLPREGTQLPLPFFSFTVVGLLCLVGLIYLVSGFDRPDIRALACATVCFYGWILLSMVVTAVGTTLLGFRVDVLVTAVLATAGILGFAHLRARGADYLYPDRVSPRMRRMFSLVLVVILGLGGLAYAQQIPSRNEEHIDHAYTDTDGSGERADRFAPDAAQYYQEIDEYLRAAGHPPEDTVVLTDEIRFLSYYPYFGFQAFTSHYANPLGEYTQRNQTIEHWAEASWGPAEDPEALLGEFDGARWRGPDAFIMRADLDAAQAGEDAFKLHLSEDIYPNQPNVRYRAVFFNPQAFESSDWKLTQIGPFVVGART